MKRTKPSSLAIVLAMILWSGSAYGLASEEEEKKLGYFMDAELTDCIPVLESERITRWVQEVGKRIVAVSGRPQLPYTFKVIIDPVVNAFSGPGGHIYITTGLLLDHITWDDELAAVEAHEIAHVTERHQMAVVHDAQVAKGVSLGLQIIAAGAGGAVGGAIFQGLASPTQTVTAQLQADLLSRVVGDFVTQAGGAAGNMLVMSAYQGFRREDEEKADELAVHYLYQSGFNPDGFVSVLRKLDAVEKSEMKAFVVPHFLASHPNLQSRIVHVQSLIATLAARKNGN